MMKEQLRTEITHIVVYDIQVKHDEGGPTQETEDTQHYHPDNSLYQPSEKPLSQLLLLLLTQVFLKDLLQI